MENKKKIFLKILCVVGVFFIIYVLVLNLILKPYVYRQKPRPPEDFPLHYMIAMNKPLDEIKEFFDSMDEIRDLATDAMPSYAQ